MSRIQTGEWETIKLLATDSSGAGVTGATISLSVYDEKNNLWWTGTTFSSAATTVAMSEVDAVNLPGIYSYRFRPSHSNTSFILYATTATSGVENSPWFGELKAGDWADHIDSSVLGTVGKVETVLRKLGVDQLEEDVNKLRFSRVR